VVVIFTSALPQEKPVGIGPVQADVASGAVLVFRVGHVVRAGLQRDAVALPAEVAGAVVTFQAYGEDQRAAKQTWIH